MSTALANQKGEFIETSEVPAEMPVPGDKLEESQPANAFQDAQPDSLEKDEKRELKPEKVQEATLESGEAQAPAPESDPKLIQKAATVPKTQFLQ